MTKKNVKKDKVRTIKILLVVFVMVLGICLFANKNVTKDNKDDKKVQVPTYIQELESSIISFDRNYYTVETGKYNYMYANERVDKSNIGNHLMFGMIFNELMKDGYDDVYYLRVKDKYSNSNKIYNSAKYWDVIDKEDYCGPECDAETKYFYKINRSIIHEYAVKLFGVDNLKDDSYNIDFGKYCSYSKEEKEYFCHVVAGGGTGTFLYVTKFDHYEEDENEVVIYQKAYFIGMSDDDNYDYVVSLYYGSDNKGYYFYDDIKNEFQDELYQKYGRVYKTVFLKKDGKYYWFYSEPKE